MRRTPALPALALLPLLAAAGQAPATFDHLRYERPLTNFPPTPAQTCVALPADLFAHAAPGLADLRLLQGSQETPYALRTATAATAASGPLTPLNLGTREGVTTFDAAMPPGSYTDLELSIDAQNFLGNVTVTGSQTQTNTAPTMLGHFTIFDLTAQRLGRSTVLHLPETDFRYLHFRITGPLQPNEVTGISVAREPAADQRYLAVASTSQQASQGRATVFRFTVPAHVPVDRVVFFPPAEPSAFSRDVEVTVTVTPIRKPVTGAEPPTTTTFSGNLLRLHRKQDGQQIDEDRLTLDTNGDVAEQPATWTVAVNNGDDPPLAFRSVQLDMLEHDLCFNAAGGNATYSLFYGDPGLASPHYDYATLFSPERHPAEATAGPERLNPAFQPRPDSRPFTERHPTLLWITLLLALALLAAVALRSGTRVQPPTGT